MKKLVCFMGLMLGSLLVVAPAAFAFDKIYVRGKPPVEGTISEIHREYVVLEKNQSQTKFATNDIIRIVYDEDPAELIKGREQAISGQVEQGLKELQSVPPNSLKRREIRQDLDYYKAYCLAKIALGSGTNLKQADEAIGGFFTENKMSFHFFDALDLWGQLAVAQGDWENAAKRFGFLGKAPWPEYKLRGTVSEARAFTAQKDYPKALEKYDAVIANEDSSAEGTRQKLLARVGKAACMAETGQVEPAITLLEDVIKGQDSKDVPLFARAYNALGRCHLKQKKDKEALLDYLHVDLLFFSDAESHAEALYYLNQLWTKADKSDRAVAARGVLQQRYAGSLWAKQL